ncbi:P-loop containing nucleoside triphosphate hydrolase protein [Stereum hirsutum FP-91666 SS1]|uniref:P-loop containing nucleoside triphosphate hydrolase protein n=1 Tax=Stereum hirsutum (strain FP-91666) TaxID=721885 RepID=UPI000440FCC7|nr:P-loop containing nucleoside triphosphate hydrolase protein [Stereum hirsutum FP-91666 SS1]EIM90382.1 P-loop containing nucleoside triphosphate hydrolase protein [Stereum hirsutum FP-91666 SS1]
MGQSALYSTLQSGLLEFEWEGTSFLVYKLGWQSNIGQRKALYDFVFGSKSSGRTDEPSDGEKLVTEVYRWQTSLKDEMWVFQDGSWQKDKEMWKSIQACSWDDLVLERQFQQGLARDTETFFSSKDIYQSLGITWKRGLLLLGPPGNGKTESIKVLLKESGQAALYVKSFTTQVGPEHGVRAIFNHARANAPCILVLEDLDSMVGPGVRSFFLNELDGLTKNEGILTIATTNHPERIDDAILNRPSRFDVKYDFILPTPELRTQYSIKWLQKIVDLGPKKESTGGDGQVLGAVRFERKHEDLAKEIAEQTDGWSFAFLKELFVSFLLRLAHDRSRSASAPTSTTETQAPDAILINQISKLDEQIRKGNEAMAGEGPGSADGGDGVVGGRVARRMMRGGFQVPMMMGHQVPHTGANF